MSCAERGTKWVKYRTKRTPQSGVAEGLFLPRDLPWSEAVGMKAGGRGRQRTAVALPGARGWVAGVPGVDPRAQPPFRSELPRPGRHNLIGRPRTETDSEPLRSEPHHQM